MAEIEMTAPRILRMPRDGLLDALRGFALVMIVLDHINPNLLAQFTPRMFGFSDMAELFVLVSGISCGVAYSRRLTSDGIKESQRRAFLRAFQIYAAYFATMIIVTPLTWVYDGKVPALNELTDRSSNVLNAWKIALMDHSWGALPILKLYMLYIVLTPILVALCRGNRGVVLCSSGAVYVAVQIYTQFSGHTWSSDPLFINPLAWQFLFIIGLTSGAFRSDWKWSAFRDWRVALAGAAVLQVAFVVKAFHPWNIPGTDNVELGPLRIIHVCSLMIVICWAASHRCRIDFVRSSSPSLRSLQLQLQLLGRNALFAFCTGEILVAAANCVLKFVGYSIVAQICISLIAVGIMWGLTWRFSPWQVTGREATSGTKDCLQSASFC